MKKEYYHELNLVRIIVAIGIAFFFHYMIIFGYAPGLSVEHNLDALLIFAYIGVELFFTISGFVMYMSYHSKIKSGEIGFAQYIGGRVRRIYPMMILSVIFMALAQWGSKLHYGYYSILNYDDGRNTFRAFILSVFGVNSDWVCDHDQYSINGVTWFISIIMICYILFFAIVKLTPERKTENLCYIAIMILGMVILRYPLDKPLLYNSCGRGYLDFFLGAILAQVVLLIKEKHYQKYASLLGICAIASYFVIITYGKIKFYNYYVSFLLNVGILLVTICVPIFRKISTNRFIAYAGDLSFDIYLWNLPSFAWGVLLTRLCNVPVNYWFAFVCFNIIVAVLSKGIVQMVENFINTNRKKENKLRKIFTRMN